MWQVIETECYPNKYKVAWNGQSPNWHFFKDYTKAQKFADKMNGKPSI